MEFRFHPAQELIRESMQKLCQRHCDRPALRGLLAEPVETGVGYFPALWQEMAHLGLLGLAVPEASGGSGSGILDLAPLLEELGRYLVPGPFLETLVILPAILQAVGTSEQQRRYLTAVAAGDLRCALAFLEAEGRWDAGGINLPATADGMLTGSKHLVPWAAQADLLLVPVRAAGRLRWLLVERQSAGVSLQPIGASDPLAWLYRVDFSAARGEWIGDEETGGAALQTVLHWGSVAAALDLVGNARQCLESTIRYVCERNQFGRPVGSFQAVKQALADVFLAIEGATSAAYYAAAALHQGRSDAAVAMHRAKAAASDMGRWVAQRCLQFHGGNGFTWEYDLHLHLKRALRYEMTFGAATYHRERVATALFAG